MLAAWVAFGVAAAVLVPFHVRSFFLPGWKEKKEKKKGEIKAKKKPARGWSMLVVSKERKKQQEQDTRLAKRQRAYRLESARLEHHLVAPGVERAAEQDVVPYLGKGKKNKIKKKGRYDKCN